MNTVLLVQRIISGTLFFNHNNVEYYCKQPDNRIKYQAELLYTNLIKDNIYEPWTRLPDLPKLLKDLDIWIDQDEEILNQSIKKLDNYKLSLYNQRLNKKQILSNKKNIESIKNSIQKLMQRKSSFNYLTLEDYANIKKNEYIYLNTIYYSNSNDLVFSSDPSNVSHLLFDSIMAEISNYFISIEEYKSIARSEYWRSIWTGNKYNVFDKAACDLTDEQKSLINVSTMYDKIFEHPECPENFVIEDDDMLDGWMIYQKNKIEESKKENKSQDITTKHGNAQEIFIMADREDIPTIHDMNSLENKNIIRQRNKVIRSSESGVDEVNLPDVQTKLLQKINTIKR